MQTKREYLVGLGLAKPGRGKFSTAGNEALTKARADGMSFSDDNGPVKPVTTTGPVADAEPVVKKVDPRDTAWIAPEDYRFPEAEYQAVGQVDGKRVVYSMRECCGKCRVSLLNHGCNEPTVYGQPVKIVTK